MFINKTPFDDNLIQDMGKRFHYYIYRYTVGISVVSIIIAVIGFINQNLVSAILFLILALLVPFGLHVVLPFVIKKKAPPIEPIVEEIIQTFTFLEDTYLIEMSNRKGYAPLSNPYSTIMSVIQTRKYIIFDAILEQDNQKVSLALLKAGMKEGSANDLYKFLKKKKGG